MFNLWKSGTQLEEYLRQHLAREIALFAFGSCIRCSYNGYALNFHKPPLGSPNAMNFRRLAQIFTFASRPDSGDQGEFLPQNFPLVVKLWQLTSAGEF